MHSVASVKLELQIIREYVSMQRPDVLLGITTLVANDLELFVKMKERGGGGMELEKRKVIQNVLGFLRVHSMIQRQVIRAPLVSRQYIFHCLKIIHT